MNANQTVITDMGILSEVVYHSFNLNEFSENFVWKNQLILTDEDGITHEYIFNDAYKVIKHTDEYSLNGMQALLLEKLIQKDDGTFVGTQEYIVVFRGTEISASDFWADLSMITGSTSTGEGQSCPKPVNPLFTFSIPLPTPTAQITYIKGAA